MRLEDLYKNILDMEPAERLEFFIKYSNQRTQDLSVVQTKARKPRKGSAKKPKGKTVTVTQEQFALLKSLGLA